MIEVKEGQEYKTNNSGILVVDKVEGYKKVYVTFATTGTKKVTTVNNISRGAVNDPYYPRVMGVGYTGEGEYKSRNGKKKVDAYQRWENLLRRCYLETDRSYRQYGARGVTLCDDWLCYQTFAKWYYENYKEDYVIDKDILNRGSKQYNPENCRFVPVRVNNLLYKRRRGAGDYPVGVHKDRGRYHAYLTKGDYKKNHLGSFDSMHDAFMAHKTAKETYIKEVAREELEKGTIDNDIYQSLMNWEVYPY